MPGRSLRRSFRAWCGGLSLALVLTLAGAPPARAQGAGDAPTTPNLVQWRDTGWTLAEALNRGYTVVSTTDFADGGDVVSTVYLQREKDLLKCRESFRPYSARVLLNFCVRAVPPYRLDGRPAERAQQPR